MLRTLIALVLLAGCAATTSTPVAAPTATKPTFTTPHARELAELKAKVMSADYRGDLAELAKLRDEVGKLATDADLGYLANYWSGFAGWRLAMNGMNQNMAEDELIRHLRRAAADMYAAIAVRAEFADAYAAAAGINGWILGWMMRTKTDDGAVVEHARLALLLLGRAKSLEPRNPRVLWIQGGFQLTMGPARGGGTDVALATFRDMVALTEHAAVDPQSPLPDWGKPEALMMLANVHLAANDVGAARDAAKAALALEPDWAYVRDNLIPKIDATKPGVVR
jgi:hypothetical protein